MEIKIKKSWIKNLKKFDLRNQSYSIVLLQAALVVCIIALFIQAQHTNIARMSQSVVPSPTGIAVVPTNTPTPSLIPTVTPTTMPSSTPIPIPTPTPIYISKDAIEVATKMYVLGGEEIQKSIKKETSSDTKEEAITKLAYAFMTNPTAYAQVKALVEIQEQLIKNKAAQGDSSQPPPVAFPPLPQMHFTNCSVSYLGNIVCTTL